MVKIIFLTIIVCCIAYVEWSKRRYPDKTQHSKPHIINGACVCICDQCVTQKDFRGRRRCQCKKCNQECPAAGRLVPYLTHQERQMYEDNIYPSQFGGQKVTYDNIGDDYV